METECEILKLQVECGGGNSSSKLAQKIYSFEEGKVSVEVAVGEVDT